MRISSAFKGTDSRKFKRYPAKFIQNLDKIMRSTPGFRYGVASSGKTVTVWWEGK